MSDCCDQAWDDDDTTWDQRHHMHAPEWQGTMPRFTQVVDEAAARWIRLLCEDPSPPTREVTGS